MHEKSSYAELRRVVCTTVVTSSYAELRRVVRITFVGTPSLRQVVRINMVITPSLRSSRTHHYFGSYAELRRVVRITNSSYSEVARSGTHHKS